MGGQEWTGSCWLWGKRKVDSHEGGSQKPWAPFEGHPWWLPMGGGTVDGAILGGCGVAGMSEESVEVWG